MNILSLTTNPTQLAGLAAFAASTLACAWAFKRKRRGVWAALAAAHALLWLDILLDTRHRLHDAVNAALRALGVYESRGVVQALLLAALACLLVIVWRRHRRAGAAVGATLLLLALVLVEAVSWHQSDRVLYTQAGPLLLVAWGWIAGAGIVVFAALRR